jgi:RHS repeat-associated protein
VNTVTAYDVLGRVASVTNPYYATGDATYGVTTYTYDALGRTTSITDPDASQRLISYSGAWSELQDEGNGTNPVSRIYQHDGLGRLVTVCEVSSANQQNGGTPASCGAFSATGYLTTYAYSGLSDLTNVTQGAETRTYGYDGLSRLISESNPEALAATTYTYDATSQQPDLYQRVAPAPNQTGSGTVITTYQHDALHRLVSKAYSDGATPSALYYYDQSAPWGTTLNNYLGRLTTEGTNNGSWVNTAEYSYDKMGRAALNVQAFPTQYNLNYTYNYLGGWATSTNGMGTTLSYGYNQADQLTSLTSSLSDANHPSSLFSTPATLGYNALGSLISDTLGNGSETLTYDKRGRLSSVATIGPAPGNNTAGKGSVAISGTEQVITTTATGSVTIGGTEKFNTIDCHPNCLYIYDAGTVTITTGGIADHVSYLQGSTDATIAAALVTAINGDTNSVVTASQSGASVILTSKLSGSGGNYALSSTATSSAGFVPPSFTATASGSALSGGTSLYDTGTVSVTVGGIAETVNYGQNDTSTSIVTNLATAFTNDSGSLVNATASGTTLNLTSKATGSGSNYNLLPSTTWNTSKFSHASFATSPSGGTLTGGANGEGTIYNLSLGYAPNSDIASANDTVNGNWTYGYDDFNRLTSAKGSTNYTFAYDRYGNRWQENPGPQYSFTGNNNRLDASSGVTYDTPGNMTNDGLGHTYFYDAENRLVQVGGTQGQCSTASACYIYDAEGRRAGKTLGASTVYYLYDLGGNEVAEVSSAGVWNRGEVYAGSRHLATYSGGASGVTYFATADWLGTERMRTGMSGPTVETCTSQPFGDAQTCTGTEVSPMHFTGQHFDSESFLSHMDFRSMSPAQGRWTSMDPARMAAASPANPQSWNLYAYVLNNPVRLVDPSGLNPQGQNGGGTGGSAPPCNDPNSLVFCGSPPSPPPPPDKFPYLGPGFGGSPRAFAFASNSSVTSQLRAAGTAIGNAWLKATVPIGRAADWVEAHPLATLPLAGLAFVEGNSGPIEEDAGIVESEAGALLEAIEGHGRTITVATEGSEELRYLDAMRAEANAGGPDQMSIILRANSSKAAILEEFLHGTQNRLGIIDRLGVEGAERHVVDFMGRHSKLLGLEPQ